MVVVVVFVSPLFFQDAHLPWRISCARSWRWRRRWQIFAMGFFGGGAWSRVVRCFLCLLLCQNLGSSYRLAPSIWRLRLPPPPPTEKKTAQAARWSLWCKNKQKNKIFSACSYSLSAPCFMISVFYTCLLHLPVGRFVRKKPHFISQICFFSFSF